MPLVPELWLLSERAKMKEFTTFAVPRSFLPELHFFRTWVRRHILNIFQTNSDMKNTLKEWPLLKKGPTEAERVARGHFHGRAGVTSAYLMCLGFGPTPKPSSVSKNGSFENFMGSKSNFG